MDATMPPGQVQVLVRGGGSIGLRHARLASELGYRVGLCPVRPGPRELPAGVGLIDPADADEAAAAAELVVVATDTGRHVADAVAALDAGARRLLVEKPLSATAAQAAPLLPYVGQDQVHVAAPLRAMQGFRELRERADALPGPLSLVVTCQSWLPDWRPGRDYRESYSARADEGGVLRDLVHEIDCATVLGGPARLQCAELDHTGPLEMAAEQAATLMWRAPRAQVLMRLDYTTRPGERRYVVGSSAGRVVWDVLTATVQWWDADGGHGQVDTGEDRDAAMRRQMRWLLTGEEEWAAPASLAEALDVMRLCDEARGVRR